MTGDGSDQDAVEERWRRQIEAYHDAALLYAAVTLGLPDRMGGRNWTAERLAAELEASPPHLYRFLRALATLGVCTERPDGTFALTPAGQSLAADAPSPLAAKASIVVAQYWRPWADLLHSLRTGEPAFQHVFGATVRDWRRVNAAQGALFETYLAKTTLAQADPIVAVLDLSEVKTVAAIGGGHGGTLAALLRAHPRLAGILFDQPHIVAGAEAFLQSQGVAGRMRCVGGDILRAIPVAADLYLLAGVLQQWDDEAAAAILRNCRAAMPPDARLLIVERLLPERASDDPTAIMLDLHMMAITGGRGRSLAAFAALLSHAGLALAKTIPTQSGLTVIEALPVGTTG
jgi:O-methyltransferase domain